MLNCHLTFAQGLQYWEFPGSPVLGLSLFTAMAWVHFLVGQPGSCKLCNMAKIKKTENRAAVLYAVQTHIIMQIYFQPMFF